MKYNNGEKYKGYWNNDKRERSGVMKFNNRNLYDGNWKNERKNENNEIY